MAKINNKKVFLNTDKVKKKLAENGYRLDFVKKKSGLKHTEGSLLFSHGVFPGNAETSGQAVKTICELTGLNQKDILIKVDK